jgi:hypothetical protein
VLFVIPFASPIASSNGEDTSQVQLVPRLRSYVEFTRALPVVNIPKQPRNKKLSMPEKRRRQILESYKALFGKQANSFTAQINTFLAGTNDADKCFLGGNSMVKQISKKRLSNAHISYRTSMIFKIALMLFYHPPYSIFSGGDQWEGAIAYATGRRHWSEEWMVLTKHEITLFKRQEARRITLRIPVSSIMNIRAMNEDEVPINVGYINRIYIFMHI